MKIRQNISQFISAELVNANRMNNGVPPEVVLDNLISTLKEKEILTGKFISKKLDNVKKVADLFMKCNYVIAFENIDINFSFLYIKANNHWQVHNFELRRHEEVLRSVA